MTRVRVDVFDGLEKDGFTAAWVRRVFLACRKADPGIPPPNIVALHRGMGWGAVYHGVGLIEIHVHAGRPIRSAWVLCHELRHLSQRKDRSRRWRQRDANKFADSVMESMRREGKA